ncbi:MAG: SDR family oxidoreductase [Flavobacteriales bacterium]|nr:SDR family oxidoreductase [Flavobacteriales bacterium]
MRILITGANGLLGQKLVELIDDQQIDFIATGSGPCRLAKEFQSKYQTLDITSASEIANIFNEFNPTHVINGAAMTNVDACEKDRARCREVNTDAVRDLLLICEQRDIHLIHISTDFIFDGEKKSLYTEKDIANPVSFYGHSKNDAEQIVFESEYSNWTILRTILVYGVIANGSRSNIVLWVKNSLEQGKKINVVNDQFRTPTLAEDLAKACLLVAKKKAHGVFNISGPDYMSMYDLALKVAEHFGLASENISEISSKDLGQPAKRPPKTGFVLDKAIQNLDYEPTPFSEGLRLVQKQLLV